MTAPRCGSTDSWQWCTPLVKRYETEGTAAFEPRSRRPHTNPCAVIPAMKDRIMRLRKTLTRRGLDAGAQTIAAHGDIMKVTVK